MITCPLGFCGVTGFVHTTGISTLKANSHCGAISERGLDPCEQCIGVDLFGRALGRARPRRCCEAIEQFELSQRVRRIVAGLVRQILLVRAGENRTRGAKCSGNRGVPCKIEDRLSDWPGTNPREIEDRLRHGFAAHLIVERFLQKFSRLSVPPKSVVKLVESPRNDGLRFAVRLLLVKQGVSRYGGNNGPIVGFEEIFFSFRVAVISHVSTLMFKVKIIYFSFSTSSFHGDSLLFILRRKPEETVASSLSGKKAFRGARPGLAALRAARSGFRLRPIFDLIYNGAGEIHIAATAAERLNEVFVATEFAPL